MGAIRSVFDHEDAVLAVMLEEARLQVLGDEVELVDDGSHCQQGHHVDDHCVAQEIDHERLEIVVDAVLHAVRRESHHHRPQAQKARSHLVQAVPQAPVQNLAEQDCQRALALPEARQQEQHEPDQISEGREDDVPKGSAPALSGGSHGEVGDDEQPHGKHEPAAESLHAQLQLAVPANGLCEGVLVLTLALLLLALVDEESEEEAEEVGPHADDGVGLVVYVEVRALVEEFAGLEEHVLALQDREADHDGDEHDQAEERVAEGLLGAVDDEERGGEEREEDVGLHDPEPGHAALAVELQAAEDEPDLIDGGRAVCEGAGAPELVERLVGEAEAEVGHHAHQQQHCPLPQQLVEEVAPQLPETAQLEQRLRELRAEHEDHHAEGELDVAEEHAGERVEPAQGLGLVGSDGLAEGALHGEEEGEDGEEEHGREDALARRARVDAAVALVEVEELEVLARLRAVSHQRVHRPLGTVRRPRLLVFLDELVLDRRAAREHDRPHRQRAYPQPRHHCAHHHQWVRRRLGRVVVDLPVLHEVLHRLLDLRLVADLGYAEASEGVDVGGVVAPVDEEVVVGHSQLGVLALVLLPRVVGGDPRVHHEGQDLRQVLPDLSRHDLLHELHAVLRRGAPSLSPARRPRRHCRHCRHAKQPDHHSLHHAINYRAQSTIVVIQQQEDFRT